MHISCTNMFYVGKQTPSYTLHVKHNCFVAVMHESFQTIRHTKQSCLLRNEHAKYIKVKTRLFYSNKRNLNFKNTYYKWTWNILDGNWTSSRKFQIATVELNLYSIVILLTLIIFILWNILLSIMSHWESLINLAMCKTETLSPENSQRENREGKRTQYHCMSTSLPSRWENGTFCTPSTLLESQSCILDCDYS